MPHTFTSPERTAVGGTSLDQYGKLEIQNPGLDWVDVSTALGDPDWFNSAQVSDSIDSNTMQMTANLLRDSGTLSLAPLRTDSTLNRDDALAYAPMIDLVRMWRLSVAVMPDGDAPVYKEIAKGYIDTIDVDDASSTIQVAGRGEEAVILDTEILEIRTYSVGTADDMETVIQALLDDNLDDPPTLYVPVASSFIINEYEQDFGNLMSAIQAVASLKGGIVRYFYDASGVNRFTLLFPNRDADAGDEDWTIGPDEYQRLPLNRFDISGVRNFVSVRYNDFDTAAVETVQSPTSGFSTSIAKYKRRSLPIDLAEDTQIMTAASAQALADAIRSDLEVPTLQQRFVTYGFWFVQLCDYGKLLANGVHYDEDQYGGVRGFTHEITNAVIRTSVDLGAQPSGGYRKWITILGQYRRLRPPGRGPIGDPMLPPFVPGPPPDPSEGTGGIAGSATIVMGIESEITTTGTFYGGGGGGGCHDHDDPEPFADAFFVEDFGRSYASYAAWAASLPSRYTGYAVISGVSFGAPQLNGNDTMYVPGNSSQTARINKDITSENTKKLWTRSLVYIDSAVDSVDILLGASAANYAGGSDYFPSRPLYDTVAEEVRLLEHTQFTPDATGAVAFNTINDGWASVVQLMETDTTDPRCRVWVNGNLVIDSEWATLDAGLIFDFILLDMGKFSPGGDVNYGLIEFVNAELFPDPYCLL